MRGEILGVERRRRWSDDQKLPIVASVRVKRATVAQVAQHHEVTWSQIYSWRRELKHKGLLPEGEAARFLSLPPVQAAPSQSGGEGLTVSGCAAWLNRPTSGIETERTLCRVWGGVVPAVIPPFLRGLGRRIYAAILSFWAGVMPPLPMLSRVPRLAGAVGQRQ